MLYDLEAIRRSEEWAAELDGERMEALSQRFISSPDWIAGDQDWLTLMSWNLPQLTLELPCTYNVLHCETSWAGSAKRLQTLPCQGEIAIAHMCNVTEIVSL